MSRLVVAGLRLPPVGMVLALLALTATVASCGFGSAEETEETEETGMSVDPVEAMPAAMIGQWRIADETAQDDGACDTMAAGAAGLVATIRPEGFGYFEEGGFVIEVHEVGDRRIDATFDTTYVELRESRVVFELIDDAASGQEILRVTPADDSFFVEVVDHLRCPDVVTEETTASTEETTASTDAITDSSDADPGIQFDFGAIVDYFEADGSSWISFDRFQSVDGTQGVDWTTEPIYAAATDFGFLNENPQVRNYRLAPSVELLEIANLDEACADLDLQVDWQPVTLERFQQVDPALVGVTFTTDGEVTRLRDNRGC